MVEKRGDLGLAHDRGVATPVKEHKSPDPSAIRDLCAFAIVAEPKPSANLLE
jgi:hypothetical protein